MGQGRSAAGSEDGTAKTEETVAPPPPPEELVFYGIRWPSYVKSEAQIDAFRAVPCQPDDIFVCTYPKCGTHWVHKLCQLILKTETFMFPMEFNEWDKGLVWQGKGAGKGGLKLEEVPAPRIVATHAPIDFLPKEVESKGCRVIYVVREPKDMVVSLYHFAKAEPNVPDPQSLDAFVDRLVAEASGDPAVATEAGGVYGGYAHHVLEYVKASRAGRNVFLMSYDRLHAQTDAEIVALATFFGVSLSDEEVASIREKSSFDCMKKEAKSKEQAKVEGKDVQNINTLVSKDGRGFSDILWRNGKRGDGKKTLTPEQTKRLDDAYGEAFEAVRDVFDAYPEPSSPLARLVPGGAACCCSSRPNQIR